jgi:hypothetical protein
VPRQPQSAVQADFAAAALPAFSFQALRFHALRHA